MHLTKTIVDKLSYAKVDNVADYRWDNKLPGFGVRVYPRDNNNNLPLSGLTLLHLL